MGTYRVYPDRDMVTQYANPPSAEPPKNVITGEDVWLLLAKSKENQHFMKIEALNQAAKNLREGNYLAFEEFTSYGDSDYDSSDYDEEPPHPVQDKLPQPGPIPRPPPKSDKNHDVKPKPGKKPACAVPDELMMCEQGFLELLSVKTIGDDHELFGKFIDVLKEAPDAVFPTPKEAVINHFDGKNSASKDLPKAIIIQQAKKVYIEESTKGIVRSLKPDQRFFEKSWETFYKLYLHMKYGQDQRVDMDTFKDLMEDFLFSKYGCLFNLNTDLSALDFSDSGFSDMDDLFKHLVWFFNLFVLVLLHSYL